MRVRILTAAHGFPSGQEVEMDDREAATWVGSGRAEVVAPTVAASRDVVTETADRSMTGAEAAVTHGRRRR